MRKAKLSEVALVISGQHILESDHNRNAQGVGYLTGPSDFGTLQPIITRWTQKPIVECEPGDILVTVKGAGVGKINIAPDETVAIGRQLMAIRGNREVVETDFLFCFLLTRLSHFQDKAVGATVPGLSREDLETLIIPLPHIKEQRRIASRLKAQLAAAEEARSAAQAQLYDSRRLIPAILKAAFAETADADMVKIGDVAHTTSGTTPARDHREYWEPAEYPWVKTGEIAFAPILSTVEKVSSKALKECSLPLLPKGTVLLAMYGQGKTRGQSAILEIEATTNQACFAIFPNDVFESEYLQYWLHHSYEDLRALSDARGGNQSNLNGNILNQFEVPLILHEKQHGIIRHIKTAIAEAQALQNGLQQQLVVIEQLPTRLLAQAFEVSA